MNIKTILLLFVAALLVAAQSHSATVAWTDPSNPAGTTYNVYRAPGVCIGGAQIGGPAIASSITAKLYQDATVTTGAYCYAVTAVYGGLESAQSPGVQASIPPVPPVTVTVFAK